MSDLKLIKVDTIGHYDRKFAQEPIKQTKSILDKLNLNFIETSSQNRALGKNYVHHENQSLVIKSDKKSNKLVAEEIRNTNLYCQDIRTQSRLTRINDWYDDIHNKSTNLLEMRQNTLKNCQLCIENQNDLIQTITGENKQEFEILANIVNQQIDTHNDIESQRILKFQRTFDNKLETREIKFPKFKVKESTNRFMALLLKIFNMISHYISKSKENQKLLQATKNDADEALRTQHDLNYAEDLMNIISKHLDDCVLHEAKFEKIVDNCLSRVAMIALKSEHEDVMQEINHYVDLEWEPENYDLVGDGYDTDEDYYSKLLDEAFEDSELFKPLHQTELFKETFLQMNKLQRDISEELLSISKIEQTDPWVRMDITGQSLSGEVKQSVRRLFLEMETNV